MQGFVLMCLQRVVEWASILVGVRYHSWKSERGMPCLIGLNGLMGNDSV
jgi:hypothetical protein